ncbi:MAG: EF-hand domain-containing protein [Deltaproteobacteria bacterium]|nr:EF-hand domain-containing protein [Deltaproteobacteria bacterium]
MNRRALFVVSASLAIFTCAGCGQVKNRDDKVVVVQDATSTQHASRQLGPSLDQIRQFIELYFGGNGVSRAGLSNLLEKYKDQLGKFLAGTKLSPNELIELLFKFDANGDGKLTPGEVAEGLNKRIPILRWIPHNAATITRDQLAASIMREFPEASINARDGLTRTLMRFDEVWAEGNADGMLSRQELSTAGLILGMLQGTDFTIPITQPDGATAAQALVTEQLHHKVNQQIFGRFGKQENYTKLPAGDIQAEWMQLALRFYLTDRLTHHYNEDGKLAPDQQAEALSNFGPSQIGRWAELRRLYGSPLMGGDGDKDEKGHARHTLNTIESFTLLSDLDYVAKLFAMANGDVSAANIARLPGVTKALFLGDLLVLYPRTAWGLILSDGSRDKQDNWTIRNEYWDGLRIFDTVRYGGNGDGKLDLGEFAMALAVDRISENLFALYDTDHSGTINKAEAAVLFKEVLKDKYDKRIVDAFFADLGLDEGKDPGFWAKLKAFFSGRTGIDDLSPFEFYVRLVKSLPRLLHEVKV